MFVEWQNFGFVKSKTRAAQGEAKYARQLSRLKALQFEITNYENYQRGITLKF